MKALAAVMLVVSGVTFGDTLTLEAALQTAQEHQPTLIQARAQSEAAAARVDGSRSGLLPQIGASLGYSRTTSNFAPTPGTVPNSLTTSNFSLATSDFFSSSLRVNQLIYDFGATWQRYRASEASARASKITENTSVQTALYNVRSSYFQAQAAHALLAVNEQQLHSQELHLAEVQGFVEVGSRPAIDLAKARTDRANAKLALIKARADEATAKARLNVAMGVEQAIGWSVSDAAFPPVKGETDDLKGLLSEALANRPEFQALEEQVTAQELTGSAIAGTYWPSFGATAALTANGKAVDALGVNVSVGLSANWQLFQGLQTRAQEREAAANLNALKAQVEAFKQQVQLEVETAQLQLLSALEAVSASQEVKVAAEEGLRLATGRYQTGVGTQLELSDAQVTVTQASSQIVQAQLTLATARAALIKALGRTP